MVKYKKNNNMCGVFYCKKQILQFPKREEVITDEDILDLFKGLIELVKRNVEMKLEVKYARIIDVLKREHR